MNKFIQVAAGIIWRNGSFLACQRPAGKPFAGAWEFPGGKLEAGETPLQALCRELWEELNIRVERASFLQMAEHFYSEKQLLVNLHFFQITAFSGQPQAREKQNICWLTPQEAEIDKFLPADAGIIRKLRQG